MLKKGKIFSPGLVQILEIKFSQKKSKFVIKKWVKKKYTNLMDIC